MSQVQSEVRPNVTRMPMSGYLLQTGGSARKRVINPLNKQAATDQFPIQNEYRVSGVPGHTHNSSAIVSVLVDLTRTRGFDKDFPNVWAGEAIEFKAADPGDSVVVRDEDERFNRALERGIGEIFETGELPSRDPGARSLHLRGPHPRGARRPAPNVDLRGGGWRVHQQEQDPVRERFSRCVHRLDWVPGPGHSGGGGRSLHERSKCYAHRGSRWTKRMRPTLSSCARTTRPCQSAP